MLALTNFAEAKIIYTPAHRVIGARHSHSLDLNHDGIIDFKIANSVSACTDFCFFELRQRSAEGNSGVGYVLGSGVLVDSALKRGARIGPRSPFMEGTAAMAAARSNVYTSSQTMVYGPWVNVKQRYLGLRFQIKGKTHYGWALLNVKVSSTTITATLSGYAYETIPNKAIAAGKTRGHDVAKQPATLGGLALGRR